MNSLRGTQPPRSSDSLSIHQRPINVLIEGFMTPIMPEGTKCARCDMPIKNFELFVVYRFGREVQFWHKRSCILEEYGGELRFNQVHQVHQIHAVNAT
jgi:hypothetical protein